MGTTMVRHQGASLAFQPRIRRGAYFEAAWRYGCRHFSVYNRTYISSTFSDPVDEYWQVVNRVALWPVMGERQIEISGPDAHRFVQYLTPRNLAKFAVGQCKYVLITGPDGGILCDPIVMRLAEDRFWLSTSDCDLELWAKGVQVNAAMDVTISDADVSVMQVQGPKSIALLADMFGEGIADLKYYWSMTVDFRGTPLVISRTGWSGEFGYELYLADPTFGDRLFDDLMTTGHRYAVAPGSVNQIRRIESGILSWGVDMTAQENPFEVGLGRLVQLGAVQNCVGREALLSLSQTTPSRTLVGLTIDGAALAGNEEPWPLLQASEQEPSTMVGKLTSLAYSPRLEKNLAIGLVDTDHSQIGESFTVDTWDGPRSAVVTPMPFIEKRQAADARTVLAEARRC